MKHPQIIKAKGALDIDGYDKYIVIDADNVIQDSDQSRIGPDENPTGVTIPVIVSLFNITDGTSSATLTGEVDMVYDPDTEYFTIDISSGAPLSLLEYGKKYVGMISEDGSTYDMRNFKLDEFVVSRDISEETLALLPYQIEIGSPSQIVWYRTVSGSTFTDALYSAPLYEGGEGTTYATSPERVTHRGAVSYIGG